MQTISDTLWLLATAGGALMLFALLVYGTVVTYRRRRNDRAQRRTEAATKAVYEREEARNK